MYNSRKTSKGMSLLEYAAATVVLAICLGGASVLIMPELNEAVFRTAEKPYGKTINPTAISNADTDPLKTLLEDVGYTGDTQTVILQGENGPIEIRNYPTQLSDYIETMGAPGTTRVLTQIVKEITDKLVEEGEITEEQALSIIEISNKGYELGRAEEAIEKIAANSTDFDSFWTGTTEYNGEDITAGDIQLKMWGNYMFLDHPDFPAGGPPFSQSATTILEMATDYETESQYPTGNGMIYEVAKAYHDARNDGSLNNPAVDTLVKKLSLDIINIGIKTADDGVHTVGHTLRTENTGNPLAEIIGSRITNTHSGTICHTGNGSTDGINCS